MKATSHRILATALLSMLLTVAPGCGQKPSFEENYDANANRPGTGAGDPNSADGTKAGPGVDGMGGPGADGAGGAGGPGVGGKGTPGDDSTSGDKEGNDGKNDGSNNGNDDGTNNGNNDDGKKPGDDGKKPGDTDDLPGDDGKPKPPKTKTTESTFPAQTLMDATVTKDLDQPFLTSDITMLRNYVNRTKSVKQTVRPIYTDSFDQGNSGAANVENFDQVANRFLDILVVIDNSNSMREEQDNLAAKLSPLLSYVAASDWQIGVVTTDPNESCLRKLIKKTDANAASLFATAVTAGINGSNNERGILQSVRSLAGTCLQQPWIRPDSNIAVLIVSDEDNCSDGNDCPGKDYTQSKYLLDYLASIRNPGQNARVYGIIWHPSQTQSQCSTALNKANIYADAIAKTNGTWGSICDADYSATLSQISQNILVTLNSKFTLKYMPDPGSVRVYVNNVELTTGFTVTGKVVEINPAPADGSKVTVSYRYGATPINSRFVLRYAPMPDRVSVTVNGVVADPTSYAVNAAVPSIDFMTPPAERAKIAVTYTRDMALQTQWSLGETIKAGTLRVYVNSVETTAFAVTEAIGLVTFNSAPAEGATVDFNYVAVGDAVLAYPFQAPYGTPKDLAAYDAATGAALLVTYQLGNVLVSPTSWAEGRVMRLRYDNVARQTFEVMLPHDPLPGTVYAQSGGVTCNSANNLAVSGLTVSVKSCPFADDATVVTVGYKWIVAQIQDFVLAVDKVPAPNEMQTWTVWVNGAVVTNYTRDGNKFHFDAPLPLGAVVKIQLIQEDK